MVDCLNPFGLMFSAVHSINIGVITAFAGGLGNIPPGWFLCDGTNGTPDLRDKFIVATGPNFSMDDEGGAVNHDHDFTSNLHDHDLVAGDDIQAGTGFPNKVATNTTSGTTDPKNNLPTYYALAYIQYQGV